MLKLLALVVLVLAAVLLNAAPASAAVCADHPNQAAAQRAKDTRDADGDGKYCESLPCPCASAQTPARFAGPTAAEKRRTAARRRAAARRRRAEARRKAAQRRRYEDATGNVIAVTDGDTLRVRLDDGSETRVRLLGIDAPEVTEGCAGHESTRNMHALAPVGSTVTLDTDESQDLKDAFGRVLAYVTTAAGADVGAEQIKAGWAETYRFARRVQRASAYFDAEAAAENAGAGLWTLCGPAAAYAACEDGVFARRAECADAVEVARRFADGDLDRRTPPVVNGFRCRTRGNGAVVCSDRAGLRIVRF